MELLLTHGADIDAKDEDYQSALFRAAFHNKKELAVFLISKGADVNSQDYKGRSVLEIATIKGHQKLSDILKVAQ